MPKLLIFDAFTLLIPEKTVANYALLQCKTFSLKIWVCKIFDKFHVCTIIITSITIGISRAISKQPRGSTKCSITEALTAKTWSAPARCRPSSSPLSPPSLPSSSASKTKTLDWSAGHQAFGKVLSSQNVIFFLVN